ncbi:MAG: hypothetical protein OCC45_13350 [Desulfotalea sp.]
MELENLEIFMCVLLVIVIALLKSAYNDINKNYSKIPKAKEPKVMTKMFLENFDFTPSRHQFSGDVYRVRLFINCEYQAGADYITDEPSDAKFELERMKENGKISDKTTDLAKRQQAHYIDSLEAEQIK